MGKVKHIPEGHHSVTPYLTVRDPDQLVAFLKQAFGAEEKFRHSDDDGKPRHVEVRLGDSYLMIGGARAEWQPMPAMIHLYVPDVDGDYRRALAAGATSIQEPANQFYGDRSGGVRDAIGNIWWIATHIEDVSHEEMIRREREARK